MKQQIITELNKLNQNFYKIVANDFADSRQFYWSGWKELLPAITQLAEPISVLDLGCGNARFASFLSDQKINFSYLGVDSSETLLKHARKMIEQLPDSVQAMVRELDLVEAVTKNNLTELLDQSFDLIVMFGVLHHVPSFELRQKLLSNLENLLNPGGILVVAAWQFTADENLAGRLISSEKLNLSKIDLEPNDYFLDWRRGKTAVRYCHLVDYSEMADLLLATNLHIESSFKADGKNNELNQYYILKKKK